MLRVVLSALVLVMSGWASAQDLPPEVSAPLAAYQEALRAQDADAALSAADQAYQAGMAADLTPELLSELALNYAMALEASDAGREAIRAYVRTAEIAADGGLDGYVQATALMRASLIALGAERWREAHRYARGAVEGVDRLVEVYGGYPAEVLAWALDVHTVAAQTAYFARRPEAASDSAAHALRLHAALGGAPDERFIRLSRIVGTVAVLEGEFEEAWVAFAGARSAQAQLDPDASLANVLRGWTVYAAQFVPEEDRERLVRRLTDLGLEPSLTECPDGPVGCDATALAHSCPVNGFVDAEPLARVTPDYPYGAAAAAAGGFVLAEFDINAEGRLENTQILASEPGDVFDREVLNAMRRWRYAPASCNGAPIVRTGAVTFFNFAMRGTEDDPGRGWRLNPS